MKPTLRHALESLSLATQTTEGQFTSGLREIAKALGVGLTPALACQSFPQTMAALNSGRFCAHYGRFILQHCRATTTR